MWKMRDQRHIFLLTYMVALAAPLSLAFNIDATNPDVYAGEKKDFFGYKVLQFTSGTDKGIIVTAPLQLNGSGGLRRPYQNQSTQCFNAEECTKKTVDLVFLFDGSGSMTRAEFNKEKDFIVDIMASLKNTSIKFSAVQFSSKHRTVFDFNDYQDGSALEKLMTEPHMEDITNTHGALEFVMINILENQAAGASPDAIKVLVIITDGDPSDRDNGIIKKYDDKQIIRFVIGVKDATLDKFTAIASKPADQYVFKIEDYNGLKGILEKFQKRIFKMEGYSISVGKRDNTSLYFAGAPRFEHTGQVILFRRDGGNWAAAQSLNGSQIGSYFGAELCSVDIDSDGNTDFLLVGAPLFYQPHEKKEGRIYVYILSEEMQLETVLNVTARSMGRFGTTISSLADLNGDELRDVAVGAPLEDDNRGAVYIYLGDRRNGIRSTFSQRIMGQEIRPEMRFFGQAIDGRIDLGEDGLPDILIGSQGMAVVLRSRPVFNVTAHLSFLPKEISTEEINCVDQTDESLPMGILQVCFEMVENTKSKSDVMSSGLNISYMLNVDPVRQTYRGFFGNDKARSLTSTCNLTANETCFQYPVNMPKCLKDAFSPITIKFNFSQVDSKSASAVLNVDSSRSASVEVPFEKQCAKNDNCVAELEVDFNFMTPALLVAEDSYFNVTVKLSNYGDDSYNTSLTMHYPPGLSFSRMIITEATRPTLHSCHDLDGVLDKTVCGVSLPVYRSKSAATFITTFLIMPEYEWNDTIVMTVTGRSDNANITENNSQSKSIPVQFEIKMGLTVKEGTTTYLNFRAEEATPKKMEIIYKIDNPGFKAFPVNVSLFFPTQLEHNFEMKDYQVFVQQNKTQCRIPDLKDDQCSPEERHKIIACDTFILDKESSTEFILSGEAHFRDLEKHAENNAFLKRYTGDIGEVKFKSSIGVEFDGRHYVLVSRKQERKDGFMETSHKTCSWKDNDPTMKWSEVRVEFIILPNRLLSIFTGVGLGLLFLIITTIIMCKGGCFKRKTFYEEDETDVVLLAYTPKESAFDPIVLSTIQS